MQDEIWKPVPNWEMYEVSTYGRVRRNNRILKNVPVKSGISEKYKPLMVTLSNGSRKKDVKVAKLVLITFVGNPKTGQVIRHLDDNQFNNRLNNLSWGSNSDNAKDRIKNNRTPLGEQNGNSKLTIETIQKIKEEYIPRSKEYGLQPLAIKYNTSISNISNIINGKVWKHAEVNHVRS